MGLGIKMREVGDGARKIRSDKLREHQYREGYASSLEGKRVEWDGENNVAICGSRWKGYWLKVQENCMGQWE